MQPTLIAIVGVLSLVAVATVADRVGVAAPLGLVVVGIALSFLPALGLISPNPHWILSGVLPPLLYATAVRTPAVDDPRLADSAGRRYPAAVVERVRDDLRIRVGPPEGAQQLAVDPREHYVELMLRALDAERGALLHARSSGRFSSQAVGHAQRSLDVEQARLERLTGTPNAL